MRDCHLMMSSKKVLAFLLFIAALLAVFSQSASATATQFSVQGGGEVLRTLSLATDDHVLVKFTIVGQTESTIDFNVTDPHGNVMAEFNRQGDVRYSFVCSDEGNYVLHFSNTFSSESKLVTLDYEIEHYLFGLPQMLFLTMVVVVICVAAVAVFILMGKPR